MKAKSVGKKPRIMRFIIVKNKGMRPNWFGNGGVFSALQWLFSYMVFSGPGRERGRREGIATVKSLHSAIKKTTRNFLFSGSKEHVSLMCQPILTHRSLEWLAADFLTGQRLKWLSSGQNFSHSNAALRIVGFEWLRKGLEKALSASVEFRR